MALIHEQVYSSSQLNQVDFKSYAEQLAFEQLNAYGLSHRVTVRVEAEEWPIGIHRAIPFGLILNELLSNAMKYAFPDNRAGAIIIGFNKTRDGSFTLQVTDDGVGLGEHLNWQHPQSLGLEIVQILAKQLDGVLSVRRHPGACFTITFSAAPTDELAPHIPARMSLEVPPAAGT